jgi:hypothetical protein
VLINTLFQTKVVNQNVDVLLAKKPYYLLLKESFPMQFFLRLVESFFIFLTRGPCLLEDLNVVLRTFLSFFVGPIYRFTTSAIASIGDLLRK